MMDRGRGSSIPSEKGVAQNRNIWIPSTPDKPVLQRSSTAQSEIHENQIGGENWLDLIDIYEDYLRNKQPHSFDLNRSEGLIYGEHNHEGVPPAESYSKPQQSQDIAPVEAYNRLPLIFNPNGCTGVSSLEHNNQNLNMLQKFKSLNQNSGRVGSYTQNLGEVVPQKVNSLAELTGTMTAMHACSSNGSPNPSTFSLAKPTITCPFPQFECNQVAYTSVGGRVQQNYMLHGSNQVAYATNGAGFHQHHAFHGNHDGGGYNQQEIPNSRSSVPKYNLNLTPRSEPRESSSASRSMPLTPDQQKRSRTHRITQVPHLLIGDTSTPEEHTLECVVLSSEPEILEKEHSDILTNSPQEMKSSDGGNGVIDLNKTPQQKPPKRSKHRPKVIVEGKPKRSPRPSSTKSNTPDGNTPAKRKYVRKNGTKTSTPPSTDKVKVVKASDVGPSTKSCKRKLNFDMENEGENSAEKEGRGRGLDYQEQENEGSKLPLDLNLDFPNAELCREFNGPSTSAAESSHQNPSGKEIQQPYNFVHLTNKISPHESMPLATIATPTLRDHTLNVIARSLNVRSATVHQYTGESRYNQIYDRINGGLANLIFQANRSEKNLGFRAQPLVQTMPRVLEDLVDVTDKQGTKQACTHTVITSPDSITLTGSQFQPHGVPEAGPCNRESSSIWQNGPETCKKKNVEDEIYGASSSMHSGITNVKDFLRQIQNRVNMSLYAQSSTVPRNGESRRQMIDRNAKDNSTNVACDKVIKCADIELYSERMAPKESHDSADKQIAKCHAGVTNKNLESVSNRDPHPIPVSRNTNSPLCGAEKKQTAGLVKRKKVPILDKVLQQEPENKRNCGNSISSKKVSGIRADKRNVVSVDDITNGMKYLHITNSGMELVCKDQSALVPYRGDGAVVPYAEFEPVKRRKPRPRVDLDPETNRLWNLLMGKEGAETLGTDKETWWEEERKVFRGRVDSFIARMHLVQGDRRFSKWKGSVVDSVIGVFLTQNVSDHLSSSAFMSLAAKFPLKSSAAREPCRGGGSPSVGKHEVHITYPDGTTSRQKMVKDSVHEHSPVTSTETFEHRADNVKPIKETFQINDHTRRTEEDIISSKSSSESFVLRASEDARSRSVSNSEAERRWSVNKNSGHISVSEQTERIAALQQYQFQLRQQLGQPEYMPNPWWAGISNGNSYPFLSRIQHQQSSVLPSTNSWPSTLMGMQSWEENVLSFFGTESISSLASKIPQETGAQCMENCRGESVDGAYVVSQDGRPKIQTLSLNHAVSNKGFELHTDSLDESHYRTGQHLIKHTNEKQAAVELNVSILINPRRPAEAFSKQPSDDGKCTEETEMRRGHSSDKLSSKTNTTTSNAKKRKAEKEKAEQCNWDTLRKQVQSKVGTTGRSRDSMDSLDYEALQNADVREISDTIKERGMNNMLAERIKSFLNRLVQDHERIDLEWLRDVEPDKAKDYLLSIWGLGLKSVECVRLLTLHHLAFPVDTNVGRIAVRLGWVPLQPLPESLQLHLLELYPVLESIQKYLWPRLCKLDQETLYELHYQMITFGKVFCSKREPNCNACPMRGECRHFASAFASARLALPGPEGRHIVSSVAPVGSNNSSDGIIKPMLLPPSEDTIEQGVRLSRDCEPFIEEPTTPELPTEVEERDIEDAFYDDPDEIPVIKLNIDEFTTNLQNFIQEQMEMGEGDMSKALVALNPVLASIPTPKLKHISRLRTEHQVYELPDSHPLLKGMDRREPDDPSPYLLAIWTPGETADSVQPPECKCSFTEGGGLCNNEACFSCNSTREAQAQTVRGTILMPCRTAMRGSFPLNGTYFQVNEVFADHESSLNPMNVPRRLLWNLPRRTVFFGSSVSSIFKGLSTEDIQYCFWRGFVCVRGFDQKTRAPRPLKARLHLPASKMAKRNEET